MKKNLLTNKTLRSISNHLNNKDNNIVNVKFNNLIQGNNFEFVINDDNSISRLKGKGRPINNLEERTKLLAALECINYVIVVYYRVLYIAYFFKRYEFNFKFFT